MNAGHVLSQVNHQRSVSIVKSTTWAVADEDERDVLAYSIASKCSPRKGANVGSDAMDCSVFCPPLPIVSDLNRLCNSWIQEYYCVPPIRSFGSHLVL